MPAYTYKVKDQSGKILQGQQEANDGRELRKKLNEQNYFIIEYTEKRAKHDILSFDVLSVFSRVDLKDISILSWQLFTMLDAGLTLTNSLKILENQTKNEKLKSVIGDVWHRIEEGTSFSEALKQHPHIFSRFYIQMINAGEVGGVLDEMLRRLAAFYESQVEIRAKIKSAMTYPILLLAVSLCVILFLLTYILPQFATVFKDMGVTVPLLTQCLLSLGGLIQRFWYVLLMIPIVCFMFYKTYTATETGRFQWDLFKLKLPVLGDLVQKTMASRFTQTLGTLISGGIPILTALEVVTDTVGNSVVAKALGEVSTRVGEGKSIAAPLEESRIFPEMVVNMIRVGEETGSLDKMLAKIAYFYDREVDHAIQMFTKLIEPIMIVFMTVIIGFIAISIFLPLTDLMAGLHQM